MSRYFMRGTPLAGLEKTMMLPPHFRPRGGGVSVRRYQYTATDCDCRYCLKAEKEKGPAGNPPVASVLRNASRPAAGRTASWPNT